MRRAVVEVVPVGIVILGALAFCFWRSVKAALYLPYPASTHPLEDGRRACVTHPARVARSSGHPPAGVYDWERAEDHHFLHVSLRRQATTRVAICTCGWESDHYFFARDAADAWIDHRNFEAMTAGQFSA